MRNSTMASPDKEPSIVSIVLVSKNIINYKPVSLCVWVRGVQRCGDAGVRGMRRCGGVRVWECGVEYVCMCFYHLFDETVFAHKQQSQ